MSSVTARIKQIRQPYQGYLPYKDMKKKEMNDGLILSTKENIHPSLVGLAVDYLTRFCLGDKNAFDISLIGSTYVKKLALCTKLVEQVKGLDDKSIINACRISDFDQYYRAGRLEYQDIERINPDRDTINNIKIMVNRTLNFFKENGPVIKTNFNFEGAYTDKISAGDGDYLTSSTIWDLKVSKNSPKPEHTLQLVIYYLMSKKCNNKCFENVENIGLYNPRTNIAYFYNMKNFSKDDSEIISKFVIGYDDNASVKKNKLNSNIDDDNYLTVIDIMKYTGYKRSQVMKLYTSYNLPLKKIKNKYVIEEDVFFDWLSEFKDFLKKQKRKRIILYIIVSLVCILYTYWTLWRYTRGY